MINTQKFSLLSSKVAGVGYIICALFVAIWPELSGRLMGRLTHFSPIVRAVSVNGVIAGLLQVIVYTYIVAWLFAWIFNKSISK